MKNFKGIATIQTCRVDDSVLISTLIDGARKFARWFDSDGSADITREEQAKEWYSLGYWIEFETIE